MNRPPAFQLYARDFLTSEKVQLMSLEVVGAYILLLCQAWLSDPPGTLPDDDTALAIFSRLKDRWPEFKDQLRACFSSANGKLVSERLRKGFLELEQYHQERSESGKRGAFSRWKEHGSANGSAITKPIAKNGSASAFAPASASAKETSSAPAVRSLILADTQGSKRPSRTF